MLRTLLKSIDTNNWIVSLIDTIYREVKPQHFVTLRGLYRINWDIDFNYRLRRYDIAS